MKREMEVEVRKIDRGLGNVYDEQLGGEVALKDLDGRAAAELLGLDDLERRHHRRGRGQRGAAAAMADLVPATNCGRAPCCPCSSSRSWSGSDFRVATKLAALSLEGARSSEKGR